MVQHSGESSSRCPRSRSNGTCVSEILGLTPRYGARIATADIRGKPGLCAGGRGKMERPSESEPGLRDGLTDPGTEVEHCGAKLAFMTMPTPQDLLAQNYCRFAGTLKSAVARLTWRLGTLEGFPVPSPLHKMLNVVS